MRMWGAGGRRRQAVLIASGVAAAVVVIGGVASAVTLTGNHQNNTVRPSGSRSRPVSVASPSEAVTDVTPAVAAPKCPTATCKAPGSQPAANQPAPPAASQPVPPAASQPAPRTASPYSALPLPPMTLADPNHPGLNGQGTVGTALQLGTAVQGGLDPYYWSVTGLPPGVTFTTQGNGSSLLIVGTPTTAGTFPVTATVRDSEQTPQTMTLTGTITINPKP